MRFIPMFALAICYVLAISANAVAQDIECNDFYTVRSGDTLQKIADRAYGRGSAYQILYSSNRETIGGRPGIIQIDTKLWIPCIDPVKRRANDVSDDLPELHNPSGVNASIKLLTGADFAPFTDEALENGGLFKELVDRSLQTVDPDLKYRVDFINDWSSHLKPLLSEGSYDMGFPWYKPDCSKYDQLGKSSRWRCDNLRFSKPFYETVVSYFGLKSDKSRYSKPFDLKGRTLCRPDGYFKFDLEVRGLVAPNVTLLQPHGVKDCFDKLMAGEVDIVTINVLTADAIIKQHNLSDKLVEYEDLATIETLHVVVPRTHPRSRPLLLRINRGLAKLQSKGIYRKVVERHLAKFIN